MASHFYARDPGESQPPALPPLPLRFPWLLSTGSTTGRAFCSSWGSDAEVPHPERELAPGPRQPRHLHAVLLWPGQWVGEVSGLVREEGLKRQSKQQVQRP